MAKIYQNKNENNFSFDKSVFFMKHLLLNTSLDFENAIQNLLSTDLISDL